MKTISWEIIVAGFLFVGISIFLIENTSTSRTSDNAFSTADSLEMNFNEEDIRVFKLQSLENLENLENIKNLENLKNLQNLENLKNLKNMLPMEIRAEFEREVEEVIREMEQESLEVNFDVKNNTLTVDPSSFENKQGWTAKSPGVFIYSRSFDTTSISKTNLNLPFGSVEINGNREGRKNILVEASGQLSTLNDLRSKIDLESSISNGNAVFQLISKTEGNNEHNIQIQSRLELPSNMELDILTNAGHISSEDIQGPQTYFTKGGHITLNSIRGSVSAETGGGHIKVKESEGMVTLTSKGGNIRVQDVVGDLELQSGGGSLQVIDLNGDVKATTKAGNIELKTSTLNGTVDASTGAGSITIWISESASAELNLNGSNIEIDPALNYNGSIQNGTANGNIGNGTYKVTAHTNYGTISIKAIK